MFTTMLSQYQDGNLLTRDSFSGLVCVCVCVDTNALNYRKHYLRCVIFQVYGIGAARYPND